MIYTNIEMVFLEISTTEEDLTLVDMIILIAD